MSTRLAGIPIDHVVAEITAFPLVSEAALGLSVTNLDPSLRPRSHAPGGESTPSTRDLWRAAEKAVVGSFPAFSVDESVSLRDRIWFNGEVDRPVPLHAYLRRTARENLVVEGTTAVPRVISDKGRETTNDALHAEEALARWR